MLFRAMRAGDVDQCVALIPGTSGIDAALRSSLSALWRELLREERLHGGVVVDAPASDRVMAFGLTAFVDDASMVEYLAAPRPWLTALLYGRVQSQRSLLLAPREVGTANAAGDLNLVVLHFCLGVDLGTPEGQAVVAAAEAGFRLAHAGHRVRRVLQEGYTPLDRMMLGSAGLRLKADYAGQPDGLPENQRPFLMGLFSEDPESRQLGTAAASLFQYHEPRFFFSLGEQRVLARAVLDDSDEEIARELGLSIAAVKKIWRRVYERVDATDPDVSVANGNDPGFTRGKEKRRNLIRYLRYHLEELRPTLRPSRRRVNAPRPRG
jgi:DNA-binding CsgD family transcriptional regulator